MNALVISEEDKVRAKALLAHAREHPLNLHEMFRLLAPGASPPGNDPANVMEFHAAQGALRFVLTLEQHPGGWFYHFSVSVAGDKDNGPHPAVVDFILKDCFGFTSGLKITNHWIEDLPDGSAVNFVIPRDAPIRD